MLPNFAPHRRKAGWGRRGMSGADDPTGFRPVVKEFENIEPVGAAVGAALWFVMTATSALKAGFWTWGRNFRTLRPLRVQSYEEE